MVQWPHHVVHVVNVVVNSTIIKSLTNLSGSIIATT